MVSIIAMELRPTISILVASATLAFAQTPDQTEFFEKHIRPILASRCEACHAASPRANFRVTSRQSLLQGGDSGPAIIPGKSDESRLYQAILYKDPNLQMPPTGKLPDDVIADFRQWIALGAPDPRSEGPASPPKPLTKQFDPEQARKFWAFQPLPASGKPATAGAIDAILKPQGQAVPPEHLAAPRHV